ncbi:hypothetical protein LCGC14_2546510 [marine sediment metagenome]|uniref:WGR domain-containing protein n=1 Tax=marine sediment metagenome TaxID=412755 RepID=A0A0F9APN4_9ZZZZ
MLCRWGRIGSKGQNMELSYRSTAAARSMASRKANQKIAKGYVEVQAAYGVTIKSALKGLTDAAKNAGESIKGLSGAIGSMSAFPLIEYGSIKKERAARKADRKKKPKPRVPKEVTFKRRGQRIG